MEDSKIVELYWKRSEAAIYETQRKYEHYCFSIAKNILPAREDAEDIPMNFQGAPIQTDASAAAH